MSTAWPRQAESSTKLNLDRQWKAKDTSTVPHLTQKVNYDVVLIRTVKFHCVRAISYLPPKLYLKSGRKQPLPVLRPCYMEYLHTEL